jgi:hypothetical protein
MVVHRWFIQVVATMALIQVHCYRKGALLEVFQMEMVVVDDNGPHGEASGQKR